MHHTKDKGDLGVLKAQVDLFEQGFTILNPLTEHAAFDLVAYREGKFRRVQVKYRNLILPASWKSSFQLAGQINMGLIQFLSIRRKSIFTVFTVLILMNVIISLRVIFAQMFA